MNWSHSIVTMAFAGTCFFMFGTSLVSENLQKIAANRIRDIIVKISNKTYYGILAGMGLTLLVQSSGAVMSMLVGLGTAGVITLPQVMGVILGVGIGTTLTVQLLSFNIAQFGLPIFAICFAIQFLTSRPVVSRWMGVGMGFGLMFWGIEMIGIGTSALKDVEFFMSTLTYLKDNPFIMLCSVAVLTALLQSSAAVIGIAISLAGSGLINMNDAFYWVYGANIGTTSIALMAASGSNYIGKQVAWSHCIHKIAMVLLLYFLTPYLSEWVSMGVPQRDVANAHLLFNVLGAILFYPFVAQGVAIIEKLFPASANERDFSVKYLDRVNFESPTICIAHAEREIMRMGDIVLSMLKDALIIFRDDNPDLIKEMRARDNKVDLLNREISLFITKYMENADGGLHKQMIRLFSVAADLESAADVIDNSMLELAGKKHKLKVEFSEEGWKEIETMHVAVTEVAMMSLSCFQLQSRELAEKVIFSKREIRKLEKSMRESHIARLVKGRAESINTSSIHMDVLTDYRRIVGLFSNHVYHLAKPDSDNKFMITKRGGL
jgi:phosphate:Na+ symporter